jgi:hypothetical protein
VGGRPARAAHRFIDFTGALTANINVIVPAVDAFERIVRNSTSGAFTLTVKTSYALREPRPSVSTPVGACSGA